MQGHQIEKGFLLVFSIHKDSIYKLFPFPKLRESRHVLV